MFEQLFWTAPQVYIAIPVGQWLQEHIFQFRREKLLRTCLLLPTQIADTNLIGICQLRQLMQQ